MRSRIPFKDSLIFLHSILGRVDDEHRGCGGSRDEKRNLRMDSLKWPSGCLPMAVSSY